MRNETIILYPLWYKETVNLHILLLLLLHTDPTMIVPVPGTGWLIILIRLVILIIPAIQLKNQHAHLTHVHSLQDTSTQVVAAHSSRAPLRQSHARAQNISTYYSTTKLSRAQSNASYSNLRSSYLPTQN